MFHSFLSDNSKQDAAATTVNTKGLLDTLLDKKITHKSLSTLWEDTDGCSESYRSVSVLYIFSAVPYAYEIIIYRDVGAPPGRGKVVVGGLDAIEKNYIR